MGTTATDSQDSHRSWSFSRTVLLKKNRRPSSLLIWTLAGATGLVGLWGVLAPLPETIGVQGKLEPSVPVTPIEAPVPGVVDRILVKEGQDVQAGSVLLRFDPRDARAKLKSALAIRSRLVNENAVYGSILGENPAAGLTAKQRHQLDSQRQALIGKDNAAREDLARSRAKAAGLRQQLASAENIALRYRGLVELGAASQIQMIESQARVDQLRSDLKAEQRDTARLLAQASATINGNQADLRSRIEENLREISDLDKQISEARVLLSNIELRAPTSGIVFDINIGPGSVVLGKGEKPLLKIVPQKDLQAKVYIPNNAIGFLHPGQDAQISLTAFPAADYGRIPAKVVRIGSDALTPEEQTRVLGTTAQGLYFPAVLQLGRQTLNNHKPLIPLQAGMSLSADIHLRDRRFISVLTGRLEDQRRGLERMR